MIHAPDWTEPARMRREALMQWLAKMRGPAKVIRLADGSYGFANTELANLQNSCVSQFANPLNNIGMSDANRYLQRNGDKSP